MELFGNENTTNPIKKGPKKSNVSSESRAGTHNKRNQPFIGAPNNGGLQSRACGEGNKQNEVKRPTNYESLSHYQQSCIYATNFWLVVNGHDPITVPKANKSYHKMWKQSNAYNKAKEIRVNLLRTKPKQDGQEST